MQHEPPGVNLLFINSEVMQRDECGFKKYKTSEKVNTKKRKADGGRVPVAEFMMLPRFVRQD